MKKKTKFRIFLVALFLILTLIFFLFIPTLCSIMLFPILDATYVPTELNIANWAIVPAQWTVACIFLYFAFTIAYIFSFASAGWKSNKGDEYGSARLMTDEEFDALIPNYFFTKDEQDVKGAYHETPAEEIEESDKVVFDYFEFEEVKDYE